MKNKFAIKWLLIPSLLIVLFTTGCKKNDEVVPETPETIFDLNVNPSFDWKTSKEITLNVTGLPVPVTVKNTIFIKSADGKSVFYTDQLEMSKNYTIKFSIPSHLTQVVISYGTITKTSDISGSSLSFDYTVAQ
jgi:hypothetical protein